MHLNNHILQNSLYGGFDFDRVHPHHQFTHGEKIWPCHSRSNVKAMVQLHQNYNNSQTIGCSVLILTSALTLSTWGQNVTMTLSIIKVVVQIKS